MKKKLIATFSFLAVVVILLLLTACRATGTEEKKTYSITMYTGYQLDPYETWHGIDSLTVTSGDVWFKDRNGKQIVIVGGPTIVKED